MCKDKKCRWGKGVEIVSEMVFWNVKLRVGWGLVGVLEVDFFYFK